MKKSVLFLAVAAVVSFATCDRAEKAALPRVLISTDIGGTDPDDNQSMAHLMMYTDRFDLEGLVSSPAYGNGSKEEMLRMIDLLEAQFPLQRWHIYNFEEADSPWKNHFIVTTHMKRILRTMPILSFRSM